MIATYVKATFENAPAHRAGLRYGDKIVEVNGTSTLGKSFTEVRNLLRGPNFAQVDFSIFKNTRLTERSSLQLRFEVFNLFNFANYADPSGGLTCAGSVGRCDAFGVSTSTVGNQLGGLLGFGGPRQIQLSARFSF